MKLRYLMIVLMYLLCSNSLFSMDMDKQKKAISSLKKICLDALTTLKLNKEINVTTLNFCQKEQIFGVISTLYHQNEDLYDKLSFFNVCDVKTKIKHFEVIHEKKATPIQKPMVPLY